MNDQHAHAGYAGYTTGSYESDPLFGNLPGSYESGHSGQYDSSQWDTGAHPTAAHDVYGSSEQQHQQYQQVQQQAAYGEQYERYPQYDATGQWDSTAWNQATGTGQYEAAAAAFGYGTTGQWATTSLDASFETGAYDATAWNAENTVAPEALVPQQFTPEHEFTSAEYGTGHEAVHHEATAYDADAYDLGQVDPAAYDSGYAYETAYDADYAAGNGGTDEDAPAADAHEAYDTHEGDAHEGYETAGTHLADDAHEAQGAHEPAHEGDDEAGAEHHSALTQTMTALPTASAAARPVRRSGGGSRGRRRTPAKRSALLTVAVPSACVLGAAGIAAASVGELGGTEKKADEKTSLAAADPGAVKAVEANSKMDTQLAALSADARDFGDRASRTQERIDLKERQAAEKKKREEEAARREALRPKFVLPVKQDGLSAYYGQSGVNWMSLHTGIDFPVQYGTPVMAATDGTVRTQWNSAYGNMAIVTAADGTETWYCHLSSTKIRSGSVKAGDVIAYSGNSGNSTGPHLHFEVRPGGGSAIDPLPWFRSHGLDPT